MIMDVVLWTAFAVLLVLAQIVVHEGAHAIALRELGIRIREAGLGLPLRPRLVLPPTERRPFALSLSPWIIAAYVEPAHEDEEKVRALPYRDAAWYAGAGVVANLILSGLLLAVQTLIHGSWDWAGVTLALVALLYVGRRVFCRWLLLPLGLASVAFIVWTISRGELGGPVAVAQATVSANWDAAMGVGILIGLSLAVINMLPLFPFDGGRVADAAIHARLGHQVAATFRAGTTLLAAALLLYVIVGDAWSLIS